MIPAIKCLWCICTVFNSQIQDCNRCSSGTPQELAKVSMTMTHAGEVLTAECKEEKESFSIDWLKKFQVK